MCARRRAEHLHTVRRMGLKCKGSQAHFQRFAGVSRLKTERRLHSHRRISLAEDGAALCAGVDGGDQALRREIMRMSTTRAWRRRSSENFPETWEFLAGNFADKFCKLQAVDFAGGDSFGKTEQDTQAGGLRWSAASRQCAEMRAE
jgi:hypothetical protein